MTRRRIAHASRFLATYILIAASGCATVFTGTSDEVSVNSYPGNAKVEIKRNGVLVDEGHTPMTAKLRKGKDYTVAISLEGYETKTVGIVKGGITKAAFLNLLSLPSWAIDFFTGAMFKFESTTINVSLQESTAQDGTTAIYAILTFSDEAGEQESVTAKLEPVENFD